MQGGYLFGSVVHVHLCNGWYTDIDGVDIHGFNGLNTGSITCMLNKFEISSTIFDRFLCEKVPIYCTTIYFNDHMPPHFHVIYAESGAKYVPLGTLYW